MSVPTLKSTHVAEAIDGLLGQLRGLEYVEGLVTATVTEVQRMESLLASMVSDTLIDDAEGAQLDRIGQYLAEARLDVSDDDEYRALLRAKRAALASRGYPEEIIDVAARVTGQSVRYLEFGTLNISISWLVSTATTNPYLGRLAEIIDLARAQGVSMTLVEGSSTGTGAFTLTTGPGLDQGKLGRQVIP